MSTPNKVKARMVNEASSTAAAATVARIDEALGAEVASALPMADSTLADTTPINPMGGTPPPPTSRPSWPMSGSTS